MKKLPLFLILILSSCSVFDNEQSISESDVIATANDPVFTILNKSAKPIVYVVIETNTSHVIDLAPLCDDFQPNLSAEPNAQFHYSEILGWDEEAESVWFYWTDCKESANSKTIKL